jgi:hypothetical protein
MAGESARAVARSRQDRAQRLLRSAAAFERGADGEEATARALSSLPADVWRVFHDLRWPGRPRANLDHVVVGPSGVFVVDTKAWSGRITTEGGVLRQNGRRRDKAVVGAAAAARAISDLLPGLEAAAVKPVLCFDQAEPVFGWVGEVMMCSTANIATMLTSRPTVLDPATVHTTAGLLHGTLQWAAPRLPAPHAAPPHAAAPGQKSGGRSRRREGRRTRTPGTRGLSRRGLARRGAAAGNGRPSALRSVLVILALGVLAVLAATWLGPFAHVVEVEARERLHPVAAPGETVTVKGNALRPRLQVSVDGVRTTRVLRPQRLARSQPRLLVAEVTIRNTGETPWVSGRQTRFAVLDDAGVERGRHPRVLEVRAGSLLPARLRLQPHHSLHGFVAFNAPRGFEASLVRVYLDPGLTRSTDWKLTP